MLEVVLAGGKVWIRANFKTLPQSAQAIILITSSPAGPSKLSQGHRYRHSVAASSSLPAPLSPACSGAPQLRLWILQTSEGLSAKKQNKTLKTFKMKHETHLSFLGPDSRHKTKKNPCWLYGLHFKMWPRIHECDHDLLRRDNRFRKWRNCMTAVVSSCSSHAGNPCGLFGPKNVPRGKE